MMMLFLGLSKLWGGGVPTSDIDSFGTSIRLLFLHRLIIGPATHYPPAVQCPASLDTVFRPDSTRYHLPTRASTVSIQAYQKPPPDFT